MMSAESLRRQLRALRDARRQNKAAQAKRNRKSLNAAQRAQVLESTAGHCHICGGAIHDSPWQADHVLAHSAGGGHSLSNYLPAHALCNNYRWDYSAEEFQYILRLGVWARTQVELGTRVGEAIASRFAADDARRAKRRKVPCT